MQSDTIFVDASFRVHAPKTIPLDHGYGLYAALSKALPTMHDQTQTSRWSVLPIKGMHLPTSNLKLDDTSRVTIRIPSSQVAQVLPLAGKQIMIQGHAVKLGVPELHMLSPAEELCARYVTIKNGESREAFEASLKRQLEALFEGLDAPMPSVTVGARRVMRIRRYTVVGYTVGLSKLSEAQSLLVQIHGLGGKRKMGAGVFLPQLVRTLIHDVPGLEEEARE